MKHVKLYNFCHFPSHVKDRLKPILKYVLIYTNVLHIAINCWRNKGRHSTMKYQSGIYIITLKASKRKQSSSERVTIAEKRQKLRFMEQAMPVYRFTALASEKILPETLWFQHYVCLFQWVIRGSLWYSEQKKKQEKCFSVWLCFSGKRLWHIYERDKQFC